MRNCGFDLDNAYDLYSSVCISIEKQASSYYCPLRCNYRGFSRADKYMVMVRKGGCRFAAEIGDFENAASQG